MDASELRAIDVRVHREVMGRRCELRAPAGPSALPHKPQWLDSELHRWQIMGGYVDIDVPIPCYSSTITAAWPVVQKLTEGEYVKVRCEQSHYHGDHCTVIAAHGATEADLVKRDAVGVFGETMPLAICRAALAACGADRAA